MVNNIIEFNDKIYIIQRTIKESNNPNIEKWRDYLNTDIVLKKNGILYFLEEIKEAEIVPIGYIEQQTS